jgi:hypothetical protein
MTMTTKAEYVHFRRHNNGITNTAPLDARFEIDVATPTCAPAAIKV